MTVNVTRDRLSCLFVFFSGQLLLERLSEDADAGSGSPASPSTVLSVCQGLFSSPALSSVFTTKYELMVALVATLCSRSCRQLRRAGDDGVLRRPPEPADENPRDPKETPHSARLFDVLLQALSCYLSVQRQQANPNRVFSAVTTQLLRRMVLLRHLLASGESETGRLHPHPPQQLCRDIRVKIDSILKLSLFPSDHLTPYKEELLPPNGDSARRPAGAKGPFRPVGAILAQLCAPDDLDGPLTYAVKSSTLPLLFKFFLESYRSGRGQREEEHAMLCFHFLTKLVSALDVGVGGPEAGDLGPVVPDHWSLALLAAESLLQQALSADIYNVAADRIRHQEVQLKFYRSVGRVLFNQAQPR